MLNLSFNPGRCRCRLNSTWSLGTNLLIAVCLPSFRSKLVALRQPLNGFRSEGISRLLSHRLTSKCQRKPPMINDLLVVPDSGVQPGLRRVARETRKHGTHLTHRTPRLPVRPRNLMLISTGQADFHRTQFQPVGR